MLNYLLLFTNRRGTPVPRGLGGLRPTTPQLLADTGAYWPQLFRPVPIACRWLKTEGTVPLVRRPRRHPRTYIHWRAVLDFGNNAPTPSQSWKRTCHRLTWLRCPATMRPGRQYLTSASLSSRRRSQRREGEFFPLRTDCRCRAEGQRRQYVCMLRPNVDGLVSTVKVTGWANKIALSDTKKGVNVMTA